jgi:hypothetical protein
VALASLCRQSVRSLLTERVIVAHTDARPFFGAHQARHEQVHPSSSRFIKTTPKILQGRRHVCSRVLAESVSLPNIKALAVTCRLIVRSGIFFAFGGIMAFDGATGQMTLSG